MNTQNPDTLQEIIQWFILLINNTLVPLIFALAFLLFLFGIFTYFFSTGAQAEEKRQQGRKFMLWAIIAFFVMISIWGIVNILVRTIPGLEGAPRPCLPTFGGGCDAAPASTRTNSDGSGTVFGNDPAPLNSPNQPVGM